MSAGPGFDTAALAAELALNVPGFTTLDAIEKFGTGQSNPTYLLRSGAARFVLRAKPPGALLKSAHQVDREYRVIRALAATPVAVPAVFYLSPEDSSIGRMFYVMDYVEGRIFWDPTLPEIASNEERAAIYDAMNATLAALHAVDVDAVGLSDFGKPGSYFSRQYTRWESQYRSSQTDDIAAMEELIAWLAQKMPPDDGLVSLVHGDYRLDNMIFALQHRAEKWTPVFGESDAKTRNRVAAVLDWELSTLGHPHADLAYQCMQWRLPHTSGFRGLGGIDRAALGLPSEAAYVEAYCRRRGVATIPNWTFLLAFSFFRLAAICQGVYRRALDGNASNPERARTYGEAVALLASLAVEAINAQ